MASIIAVVAVLIAIVGFSAPLCYLAYLGMSEQRDPSTLARERGEKEEVDTAEENAV
jgi:hypothetical protein